MVLMVPQNHISSFSEPTLVVPFVLKCNAFRKYLCKLIMNQNDCGFGLSALCRQQTSLVRCLQLYQSARSVQSLFACCTFRTKSFEPVENVILTTVLRFSFWNKYYAQWIAQNQTMPRRGDYVVPWCNLMNCSWVKWKHHKGFAKAYPLDETKIGRTNARDRS